MTPLIVVSRRADWPPEIAGVSVVPARAYLADRDYAERRDLRVFNLCRSLGYQTSGYYVSLLAAARGHRPLPSVATVLDFRSPVVARLAGGELERVIQRSLAPLQSDEFTLSIYFGRNLAQRHDRLARSLFNLFPAPLLRADFQRRQGEWLLRRIAPLGFADIPEAHRDFVVEAAQRYFSGQRPRTAPRRSGRYDLAILVNPEEAQPPSDARAIERFVQAGTALGFNVSLIEPDAIGRLAEFDALFIRETTAVNHHTYRFARRAAAEGLVVIDDPESILRCTNKVYLAELLERHDVPTPRSLVVHRDNAERILDTLELPVVLKQPDSAFSAGVFKAASAEELAVGCARLLRNSELILAQEYLPTDFDWRVGVLDGRALYVCRYHMARGHWQIIRNDEQGQDSGEADTLAIEDAPPAVIQTALRAAGLIGRGLYGVDLKEIDGKVMVIEVNDNPSIDSGVEDKVAGRALYREILAEMLRRVEAIKLTGARA